MVTEILKYRDYNSFISRDLIGLTPYGDKNLIQVWLNTTQDVMAIEFRLFYKDYFRKRNITFPIATASGGLGRQMAVCAACFQIDAKLDYSVV